jgi:parallel beta-helix repeat protein
MKYVLRIGAVFLLSVFLLLADFSAFSEDKLNFLNGQDSLSLQTHDDIRGAAAKMLRRDLNLIPKTIVSVKSFGAIGDGVTDDSDAIERATAGVANGEILLFPAGTYVQTRTITVRSPNVILWGFGAILHGSNPNDQAVIIEGDRSSVVGFRLTAVQAGRKEGTNQHRIVLLGDGNQALANVIEGGAAAGIYISGARNFRVDGNTVRNTLADGIHATDGSRFGVIANNVVRSTGDDHIAVVSYRYQHLASDILITNNDVGDGPWGRGIAVVGGRNITISNNAIRNVAHAAGVYLAREANYNTYGTSNVVVQQNVIEHIQTHGEVLGGRRRTGHGAVEIYADDRGNPDLTVQEVLVQKNVVRDALADGVRINGGVCRVQVIDNKFEKLGGRAIRTIYNGCVPKRVSCRGNTLDGFLVSPRECGSFAENITGALVQDK